MKLSVQYMFRDLKFMIALFKPRLKENHASVFSKRLLNMLLLMPQNCICGIALFCILPSVWISVYPGASCTAYDRQVLCNLSECEVLEDNWVLHLPSGSLPCLSGPVHADISGHVHSSTDSKNNTCCLCAGCIPAFFF